MEKRFFGLNLWIAFIALIIIRLFYACYDEDSDVDMPREESAVVAEARPLYQECVGNVVQIFTRTGSPAMMIKPEWKWVSMEKNEDYLALEIGKVSERGFYFVDPVASEKAKATGKSKYSQSKTSFVYLKDRKMEESYMFLMTISPTLDYMEKTNFKPFKKNSYLKRDKDFSGLIFYHDLQGKFVNGWRYKDGEIVSEITLIDMDKQDFILTRSGSTCPDGFIIYQVEQCYYTYSLYLGEVTYTDCKSWYEIDVIYQDCPVETPKSGGGDGGYGGGQVAGLTTKLKDIIKNNKNLSEGQIVKLDEIVDDLDDDCLNGNRAIYNDLLSSGTFFENVEMRPSGPEYETACYDPNDRTLFFTDTDNITYHGFTHELFHLFQRKYGATFTNEWLGLLEFERTLYSDIIYFVNVLKGDWSDDYKIGAKVGDWVWRGLDKMGVDGFTTMVEYKKWLSNITYNGTQIPTNIDAAGFKKFAEFFGNVSSYPKGDKYKYDMPYEGYNGTSALFFALTYAGNDPCN